MYNYECLVSLPIASVGGEFWSSAFVCLHSDSYLLEQEQYFFSIAGSQLGRSLAGNSKNDLPATVCMNQNQAHLHRAWLSYQEAVHQLLFQHFCQAAWHDGYSSLSCWKKHWSPEKIQGVVWALIEQSWPFQWRRGYTPCFSLKTDALVIYFYFICLNLYMGKHLGDVQQTEAKPGIVGEPGEQQDEIIC